MATQTNKELFSYGFVKLLKEQQFDVQLKAQDSDQKATISAHKLILSARSKVLKKMLKSEQCKASSRLETLTFSELKHEELEAFVEFIYSDGSMLSEKAKKHVRSLYRAAGKYEIPHLRDLCRNQLKPSLNLSNALDVLELAQNPFDNDLNQAALDCIKINKLTISTSADFPIFVVNHPNLAVEIMKAISTTVMYCTRCGCAVR